MSRLFVKIISMVLAICRKIKQWYFKHTVINKLGYCDKTTQLSPDSLYMTYEKMFFYERTSIMSGSKFIISPHGENGKFIMKKHSGAAQGLTVITGNHTISPDVKQWMRDELDNRIGDNEHDVIVEEEVWIGANVTLLPGVIVGRGSIIGAGAVIRNSVPRYSIVFGNPAKVIGFKYTPEQIEEHEKTLYPETQWSDFVKIRKDYDKYFINRISEIKSYIK